MKKSYLKMTNNKFTYGGQDYIFPFHIMEREIERYENPFALRIAKSDNSEGHFILMTRTKVENKEEKIQIYDHWSEASKNLIYIDYDEFCNGTSSQLNNRMYTHTFWTDGEA